MTSVGAISASDSDRADIARHVKAASTSFYGAMRILPRARREAIFAVYAFCRDVDDIADDETVSLAEKQAALQDWRAEIDRLYDGVPERTISRALVEPTKTYKLRRQDFLDVIDGMDMDARGPIIAPSMADLDIYCDRVACAVGRLCVCIFGEPGSNGLDVANHLGRALQMTNILRDVAEDARLGRLYLPKEKLDAYDIRYDKPADIMQQPGYAAMWRDLAALAEGHFEASREALTRCDRRKMRPARIMMEVYHLNLVRMKALDDGVICDPDASMRLVGRTEKIMIALRHGLW